MLAVLRSVASIFLGIALLMVGTGLLSTLLGLRMELEGFPSLVQGLILASYFAGLTAGAFWGGRVIQRVGHIRTVAAGAATACAATLLLPLLLRPVFWVLLRALTGFGIACLYMVAESWLNERASLRTRGSLFALYTIFNQVALSGGQLLLALYGSSGLEPFLVAALLYVTALIPVALTRAPQPVLLPDAPLGLLGLLRLSPLGVAGGFVSGITAGTLFSLGPLVAAGLGFDTEGVAAFMGAVLMGGLVLQWPLGLLSDRIDRRWVVIGVCALLAMVSALGASLPLSSLSVLLGVGGLLGALGFVIYPLHLAHANDQVDTRYAVAVSGSLLLAYGAGAVVGPLVGTAVLGAFGPRGVLYWLARPSALLMGYALFRVVRRAPVPEEARVHFVSVALPQTVPALPLENQGPEGEQKLPLQEGVGGG